jgi:hypothetical protein
MVLIMHGANIKMVDKFISDLLGRGRMGGGK